MEANYPECYKAVRLFEGGNDDDPQDPGGRTSRGIIQREWDQYRKTHPGRPADVWQADEADIAAIYKGDYWDVQRCGTLASGVDESIFDYGVNSGIGRSQKVLRRCLHMPDDAPRADLLARLAQLSADQFKTLIAAINDERLAFLKQLRTWPRFGGGWGKRVSTVKAISLHLAEAPVGVPAPVPTPAEIDATAKGQHPEPTASKTATKTAGTAAAGGGLVEWLQSHPLEAVLLVVAIAGAVAFAIHLINKAHKKKQEAAPQGWQPPAELKPA
jgi:lysozyme family protein